MQAWPGALGRPVERRRASGGSAAHGEHQIRLRVVSRRVWVCGVSREGDGPEQACCMALCIE